MIAPTNARNDDCRPSHQFVDHVSEVEMRVTAPSLETLLAEAARGLASLLVPGAPAEEAPGRRRVIEVRSRDDVALLVDWLNELLFIGETERWVPVDFDRISIDRGHEDRCTVRADARGVLVHAPLDRVKAATLHGLVIERVAGELRANVVLDV